MESGSYVGMDMELLRKPTSAEPVEERLMRTKRSYLEAVEKIDKALELLKAQPQLLETLNVLRQVGI